MALLNPDDTQIEPPFLSALPHAEQRKSMTTKTSEQDAAEYAAALHLLDLEHRKLRTGFADHLGLAHNEYDAFMFIAENHTTTPKELATILRFTTGATTALIDRLENLDLVHRIPNPTDRRSVLIELTPHGKTQAGWVNDNYTSIALTAVTTHHTLTSTQLTAAITHISTIITTAATD